jgi:uncharacterized protein (TIGR03083 family)
MVESGWVVGARGPAGDGARMLRGVLLLDALTEVWDSYRALLPTIGAHEWERRTPCPEWDVRELVAHVGGIEAGFQGLPQPEAPADFVSGHEGIDHWTALSVAARRDWTPDQVVDEALRAGEAQVGALTGLDDAGWQDPVMGPLGMTTRTGQAELRTVDLYLHLLDLRQGLGRPLGLGDEPAEPQALQVLVDRAVSLAGWGLVKKAGWRDDTRIRLDLTGPAGRTVDLVLEGARGRVEPAGDEEPAGGVVRGTAAAFALTASGRDAMVAEAGGVTADGEAAGRLLAGYRLF